MVNDVKTGNKERYERDLEPYQCAEIRCGDADHEPQEKGEQHTGQYERITVNGA
jgi:hypothetical protein